MSESPVTLNDVEVRDYLVPLSPKERARRYRARKQRSKALLSCSHPRLKTHTFAVYYKNDWEGKPVKYGGETIKMCPDCTTFDNKRWNVFKMKSKPDGTKIDDFVKVLYPSGITQWKPSPFESAHVVVPFPTTRVVEKLPFWKEDLYTREEDERQEKNRLSSRKYMTKKKGSVNLTGNERIEGFTQRIVGISYASDILWPLDRWCNSDKDWCGACLKYVLVEHECLVVKSVRQQDAVIVVNLSDPNILTPSVFKITGPASEWPRGYDCIAERNKERHL